MTPHRYRFPCLSLTDCATPSVALLGWVSISPSVKCELTEILLHPTVTSSERMHSSLSEKCQHSTHQRYVVITGNQAGCASRWALLPLHPLKVPSLAFRTSKPPYLAHMCDGQVSLIWGRDRNQGHWRNMGRAAPAMSAVSFGAEGCR